MPCKPCITQSSEEKQLKHHHPKCNWQLLSIYHNNPTHKIHNSSRWKWKPVEVHKNWAFNKSNNAYKPVEVQNHLATSRIILWLICTLSIVYFINVWQTPTIVFFTKPQIKCPIFCYFCFKALKFYDNLTIQHS